MIVIGWIVHRWPSVCMIDMGGDVAGGRTTSASVVDTNLLLIQLVSVHWVLADVDQERRLMMRTQMALKRQLVAWLRL